MLEVRAVSRQFGGVSAVDGVSMSVARGEIVDRRGAVARAVAAGELPAATDDARDFVAGAKAGRCHGHGFAPGSGTAVTSAWRKVRLPVRVILRRLGQFGSGQAISASVDIQSFGSVGRCLAGRSGRTAASE